MTNYIATLSPENNELILDIKSLFPTLEAETVTLKFSAIDNNGDVSDYIAEHVCVNGVKINKLSESSFTSSVSPFIFTLRFDSDNQDFDADAIDITVNNNSNMRVRVAVTDSDIQKLNNCTYDAKALVNKLETYMLIRTNPKLSGNIKLVVDSDYHLYLDTFKVSNKLTDRVYRKYPVSSDGNYPHDVMTVFSSLPKSELFKLPANSLNPHMFYNDYKDQYETEYEYGAAFNDDNLYTENMRLLAPLHIGKDIPDFFCIFRYDGTYNEETYNSLDIDDDSKFTNLLKTSSVVKIFDLRSYTSIGQYLNNYKKLINDFLYGSCYMQFIEQDNEKYSSNYRQGNNSWRGIDVTKGIITNKIESSYFANNVLLKSDGVQETFNDYIINGYERNNILYPYILNLEFMFNDETSDDFSMHRYFGLYLSSNDFLKYDCVIKDNSKNNGITHKLDSNDNEINDSDLIDSIFVDKYADRIFFATTNNNAARIQSPDDVKNFITQYVCNNPDKNLCTVKTEAMEWHDSEQSFLTMTFDSPIKYGEHIRFIVLNYYNEFTKKYENDCLEIVASNDKRLLKTDNFISPYISTNKLETYKVAGDNEDVVNNIYRLSFYSQSITDENESATLTDQFSRIKACIEKFDSFVVFESSNDNTIGLTSKHNNVYCQHIAPVNVQNETTYYNLYITDDLQGEKGYKKEIHFTGKGNVEDYPDNYILDLKEAVEDKTGAKCQVHYNKDAYSIGKNFYDKSGNTSTVTKVGSYVNYRDNENSIDDTIHYFTKTDVSRMTPLSPDSYYYSNNYAVFSMFGYDILGWRYSNIVKFKNISEMGYTYEIFNDIEETIDVVRHPIVKTTAGTFETIAKFDISEYFLTDNILLEIDPNDAIRSQKLIEKDRSCNIILCPYNVNKMMLDFSIKPFVHNCELAMFNPEAAALSVMGIYNVKDIDMSINLDQAYEVKNTDMLSVSAGENFYIDGEKDTRITKNTVYCIEKGAFNEFGAYKFMIVGNTVYYTANKYSNQILTGNLFNDVLTAASDMVIRTVNANIAQTYDFKCNIPKQLEENFFVDKSSIVDSMLNISIVPQTNCLWESNGLYFDSNSVLNTDDMLNVPYKQNGYFTEHGTTLLSETRNNTSSKNSIDSWAKIGDNIYSFRDLILKSIIKNPIKKMLIIDNGIDTAVGYYNAYVQSLEFVYYGIKFNLKFDAEYYTQNLQMGQYNNFEIFIINDYDVTKNNEIFISVDEEIILLINHKFDIYEGKRLCSQLHNISDDIFDSPYAVRKAPYSIYSNTISAMGFNMNVCKSNAETVKKYAYEDDVYFVQTDRPMNIFMNTDSADDILPNYLYFNIDMSKNYGKILTVKQSDTEKIGVLNKDDDVYSVSSYPIEGSPLLNVTHRTENSYILSTHTSSVSYAYDTTDIIKRYMKSFEGDFDCNVINNGDVESMTITDEYKPIVITTSIPNQIKYNFGYFMPRAYDILEFKTNDYDLMNTIDMSLLLANTTVKKVNRINTYTGNKVFDKDTTIKKNYFVINNKSIFSSNWDKYFYRSYNSTNEDSYRSINGYIPGIEDKSFFGSRCLAMKNDYILINDFSNARSNNGSLVRVNSEHNTHSKNTAQYQFTINITQSIYSLFQNNSIFVANWNGLNTNQDTAIKNYIKNTILNIFNTQRSKEIVLYSQYDSSHENMEVVYDDIEDLNSWLVVDNFKPEYSIVNSDMIVTITLPEMKHMNIHPQVKIYRN